MFTEEKLCSIVVFRFFRALCDVSKSMIFKKNQRTNLPMLIEKLPSSRSTTPGYVFLILSTFFCWAAFSKVQHSWTLCCVDIWHPEQMGLSSFRQNKVNCSLWKKQTSWSLLLCCSWYSSAAIFSGKLIGGLSGTDTVRHTGHSRDPFHFQNFCRQILQILCPHFRRTGRQ